MNQWTVRILGVVAAAGLVGSCGQGAATPPATATAAPETLRAEPSPRPTMTRTATPTNTPIPSPTSTTVPRLTVSRNTNCRSGPGVEYLFEGVLEVGEIAQLLGRSPEPGYWYVSGSGLPANGCWLLGEHAQLDGEIELLPIYTAAPSPTPQVGFDLSFQSFERCGSTFYIVYAVKNVGGQRIWSGYVEVQDFATRSTLYSARERHPFAATVLPVCPPDHGNELWPGEKRYIHVPLSDVKSGSITIGSITLCTADHQGGTCVTEYSYIELP